MDTKEIAPAESSANHSKSAHKKRDLLILTITIFLITIYPILDLFWYHDYPVSSVESIALMGSIFIGAFFLSLLLSSTRLLIRNTVIALILTISLILQFNLLFLGIILTVSLLFILAFTLKKSFIDVLPFIILAMIVGAWFDNRITPGLKLDSVSSEANQNADGPIIHIVMDGFIAPDGLPGRELTGNLRAEILSFFETYEFELHTRAYSHYNATIDSMTRVLNFRNDDENLFKNVLFLHQPIKFSENSWFKALTEQGYPVHVYQSESTDYCQPDSPMEMFCNSFAMPYLITIHRDVSGLLTKINVLVRTLLSQSVVITKSLRKAKFLDSWGLAIYDDRMLPKLASDVVVQPNAAYFAHVLSPHSPHVYRADCSIDYETPSWMRWSASTGLAANSEETRAARYGLIVPHIQCALNRLDQLFQKLREHGLYDHSTIIVHGDHGSSTFLFSPHILNMGRAFRRDYREAYSTLFAVKWPNGSFRMENNVNSITSLMSQTAMKVSGKSAEELSVELEPEEDSYIYLSGTDPLKKVYIDLFETDSGLTNSE